MPFSRRADVPGVLLRGCLLLLLAASAGADTLDTVGVSLLRSFDAALDGSAIAVAVVEANLPAPGGWEINPAAVGRPESLFTWRSGGGGATNFPNSLGLESWHANGVASWFFGLPPYGVAPGVLQVDNYEASYFAGTLVPAETATSAKLVNQSFTYNNEYPMVDQDYDNYAARYNVLFVSGAGNENSVKSPGTAYNGLSVAAQGGQSSVGPTLQGRSKPDITVAASHTSFSAPVVSGAAALLLQAIQRGDGGSNTITLANDIRLLRALLLNGAQKPADWTNASAAGMDFRHGAGVLNVFESWRQLRGGRFVAGASNTVTTGNPHPPAPFASGITARRGWDVSTMSSSMPQDGVRHYFFDVQGGTNRTFTFTATLAWNRQRNETLINNLDLFLYNATNAALVASRQSTMDNVEHLSVTNLPPGKYTLQVWKAGGLAGRVTNDETYALAFNFGRSEPARLGPATLVAGELRAPLVGEPSTRYRVEGTLDFLSWYPVSTNSTSANGVSQIAISAGAGMKFFRAVELP
jgi:hypothetical protein